MATIKDVVAELVEQTKSGKLVWQASSWRDDEPSLWQVEINGCYFVLRRQYLALEMNSSEIGTGWTTIGNNDETEELFVEVSSRFSILPDLDEHFKVALKCLTA